MPVRCNGIQYILESVSILWLDVSCSNSTSNKEQFINFKKQVPTTSWISASLDMSCSNLYELSLSKSQMRRGARTLMVVYLFRIRDSPYFHSTARKYIRVLDMHVSEKR
jgi:hypothetical protein